MNLVMHDVSTCNDKKVVFLKSIVNTIYNHKDNTKKIRSSKGGKAENIPSKVIKLVAYEICLMTRNMYLKLEVDTFKIIEVIVNKNIFKLNFSSS
jgi:hypothetical protein